MAKKASVLLLRDLVSKLKGKLEGVEVTHYRDLPEFGVTDQDLIVVAINYDNDRYVDTVVCNDSELKKHLTGARPFGMVRANFVIDEKSAGGFPVVQKFVQEAPKTAKKSSK